MARDMRDRSYDLKSLSMAPIVTKTTVAVTSSCALVTIKDAIASVAKILIGYKTSALASGYRSANQFRFPHTLATHNYSIMPHHHPSEIGRTWK
jgi:hypothetical protein